jgi:hypothetical protein
MTYTAKYAGKCRHCDQPRRSNTDWTGLPALEAPSVAEIVAYHDAATCVTADPIGINYHSLANCGR